MSYYTIFDEIETAITAVTTNPLVSTDLLLVHNVASGKKYTTTPAQVGLVAQAAGTNNPLTYYTTTIFTAGTTVTSLGAYSTSGTTAFVPATGTSIFMSTTGTSSVWVMADPTAAGIVKTLVMGTTSTSTGFFVSTVAATIASTAATAGTSVNLGNAGTISNLGNTIQLTSLSSTKWLVTGHTSNVLFI